MGLYRIELGRELHTVLDGKSVSGDSWDTVTIECRNDTDAIGSAFTFAVQRTGADVDAILGERPGFPGTCLLTSPLRGGVLVVTALDDGEDGRTVMQCEF